jgi:hypothetical protein
MVGTVADPTQRGDLDRFVGQVTVPADQEMTGPILYQLEASG